jgi:hypothetical protein
VLKICKAHNTPVVTRGAGTGLSGGAMPLEESVVLGLSKLNRIKSIDEYKPNSATASLMAIFLTPGSRTAKRFSASIDLILFSFESPKTTGF